MLHLATKYRPQHLDEIVGQTHLLNNDASFRKLISTQQLPHCFFYGPAGCGKTTLARVIASTLQKPFYEFNATTLKIEALRKVFKEYAHSLEKPIVFIDEVHRLSKNQQEVLLPYMENQSALLLGASTENPYYSLTSAIRSRAHLFELKSIAREEMQNYLEEILKREQITCNQEEQNYLINSSAGDIRAMLNLLGTAHSIEGNHITLKTLQEIRPKAMIAGSSENESHYELASAMIKSIRGSDINAGLYYLARLIEGGEPAEFIARRLAILASEDIGNANPHALNLASSTLNIVKFIGYPEARITLSQLVIYLASSPKSNSAYTAINHAQKAIQKGQVDPIPNHIKTHAKSYLYPHNFGGWVVQEYMQTPHTFYETEQIGFEKTLYEWHKKITQKS
jgi:putative ATPase